VNLVKDIFSNVSGHGSFFETLTLLNVDDSRFTGGNYGDEDTIQIGVNVGINRAPVSITNNVWTNVSTAGLNLSDVSGTVSGNTFQNSVYYGVLVANNCGNLSITGNNFD